ncbi:HPP family protein [Trinickia mobilis]|uniref:HPP family protein n=1 Tax=Trinickia mobilis TaxID=2816356 RepID=UPI001A8E6B81|nr:HPP family protein [Trinickia mobilis]
MPRSAVAEWFGSFVPHPSAPQWQERVRRCLGALLGIAFTGAATHFVFGSQSDIPMLVAPMGASTVLLFGASDSPLAQPWSIIGGNLVSATVGVACAQWIAGPVAAASVSIALAICGMFLCRCVHPPSGAVALTAVLGGPAVHALGFRFVAAPIAFQSATLLSLALVFHALTGHRYPRAAASLYAVDTRAAVQTPPRSAQAHASNASRSDEPDKSFDELTCEDIMSAPAQAVLASMQRNDALDLLKWRGATMLPVVDAMHRVIGTVTQHDLADQPERRLPRAWFDLRRASRKRSAMFEETVEAAMAAGVRAVHHATPIVDLVPMFTARMHHPVAVLDESERLVGMVTHADMIRGLLRQASTSRRASA